MDKGQLRYDIKVIRKAYREIGRDPVFCLTLFVLICLFTTSLFLILVHEPISHWHETRFILEKTEIRTTGRTGQVLDVYAADGRRFVINENDEEIRDLLQVGGEYFAVYSADFFSNIIKELHDEETEYLNLRNSRKSAIISFWIMYCAFFITGALLLILNGIFTMKCVKKERKRMKNFQKSKKKHK